MRTFYVWDEDEGEENGCEIDACDHEDAATCWAEVDDSESAEYRICGKGHCPTLSVRDALGRIERFRVTGECVPAYYARLLTESD